MISINQNFQKCIDLKKQADKVSAFNMPKKMELADQAVNLSFLVIAGLIGKVSELEKQIQQLKGEK